VVLNENRETEPHYGTIFLEARKLKTRRKIFEYGRSVDILWNPDGQSFALTDHGGSDFAVCSIINVNEKVDPIPVLQTLLKRVSVREQEEIQRNDHL